MKRGFNPITNSFLSEPTYGYTRDGINPYRPTTREVLLELVDTIDFVHKPRRWLNALMLTAHLVTLGCLIAFFVEYLAWDTFVFWVLSALFLCNGPHTMWYHRYCAHKPFKFARRWYTRLFLFTNPLYTLEEHYAIAHRQHHTYQEGVGDPYGPHIGWLASYFAIDSIQKLNVDISESRYEQLKKMVEHIGFKTHTYEQFKKYGTVEHLGHYFLRTLIAQSLWAMGAYLLGGVPYVVTWYAATYTLWFLLRDFGWRGHRGNEKCPGWEFDTRSSATNQRFYGYIASEWHDNHHLYPSSANLAFVSGQIDISFQLVRLMKLVGLVSHYNDARPRFEMHRSRAEGRQTAELPRLPA